MSSVVLGLGWLEIYVTQLAVFGPCLSTSLFCYDLSVLIMRFRKNLQTSLYGLLYVCRDVMFAVTIFGLSREGLV